MNINICDLQKIKNRLIQECRKGECCHLEILHLDGDLYLHVGITNVDGFWLRSTRKHIYTTFSKKSIKKITKYFLSTLFDNGV